MPAALRMLGWSLVLGIGASLWGDRLAQALLPLWRIEIPLVDAHWRVERLWIDHEGADQVVRVLIGLRGCLKVGSGLVCDSPEPLGNASTLVGNLTLPSVLLLALVLAWPARSLREWGSRGLCGLLALLLLWMVDLPLTLLAAFWTVLRDALGHGQPSLLVAWADFLQAGGRPALALALAAASIAGGQALAAPRS